MERALALTIRTESVAGQVGGDIDAGSPPPLGISFTDQLIEGGRHRDSGDG